MLPKVENCLSVITHFTLASSLYQLGGDNSTCTKYIHPCSLTSICDISNQLKQIWNFIFVKLKYV